MPNSYNNAAFDDAEVLREPGCAFWTDDTGRLFLGFTEEGATLELNPNQEAQLADETGSTPLHHVNLGDTARITLNMLETTLARIARICPTISLVGGFLRFGSVPGQQMPQGEIVHRPFSAPDGSRDLILHAATNIADQSFVHNSKEPMKVTCTFEGHMDENENDGSFLGGIGQ